MRSAPGGLNGIVIHTRSCGSTGLTQVNHANDEGGQIGVLDSHLIRFRILIDAIGIVIGGSHQLSGGTGKVDSINGSTILEDVFAKTAGRLDTRIIRSQLA